MNITPSDRAGIIAGGNWLVDHVKILDTWPLQDSLANILSESWANGGSPYNVLKDLHRLGAAFPLSGVGLVGDDSNGQRILSDCHDCGIDTMQIRQIAGVSTAYSDVMTDSRTGRRTFFHQRGANALLAPTHFDFSTTRARIFHLGYLLLLDQLDTLENGVPRAARVLRDARAHGLTTSLDCVSENSDRFRAVVMPVLPEIDVLFVNDFEAEKITGLTLRSALNGLIDRSQVESAARALANLGVRQWVVLHFPEGAYAFSPSGAEHWQTSLSIPTAEIKGTAGAGDAFAAGVLYGLHESWPIVECVRLGVCAAATSLFDATCSDSVGSVSDCLALHQVYPFRAQ